MTFDVLVIGGGVSGFAAALAARERGARTALVRAAPGVSALVSGAWSGPLRLEIRAALDKVGYSLMPATAPLAHERGRTVACTFAGASHVGATIDPEATVCGIAGLPHFNATTLAKLWSPTQPLKSLQIQLPGTPGGGWTSASVAAYIERDPQVLLSSIKTGGAARVVLPAVIGIDKTAEILDQGRDAGIEASEALAASPSVPGWRLLQAMERALKASDVTLLDGRAVRGKHQGSRVHEVAIGGDVVTTNTVVLATGKFTSGGINTTDEFRESVFDLPIWLEHLGDVFTSPDPLLLTDPVRSESQPLLYAGVHTDDALRPLNRAGEVVLENVFVAGTIRAGWDAALSGLGDCAENGWSAGLNASA